MEWVAGGDAGMRQVLLVHGVLTLLAAWPAVRVLGRAGLPAWQAVWLAVPVLGWPVFATILAFRPWPTLPPRPEKLHPREALRRQRAAESASAAATPDRTGG